ncbi:Hsp70 family protein [Fulvivirga sediminis]|uniref:Hsp70 family protein n=1 Tax=Fulvivirga sediminis TaxID=2803949 RepID=A0A937K203_9BACT|nr:Hsp70 family protein [Fulvivirga sediminis]MBL3658046.1 Hsp70 family protein [Fulvivirga sediminis]
MSSTIDFAIDLGTTNSAIAKASHAGVEVFKNPLDLKQTLPSVVGFRRNRIIVGDKARELLGKDPDNVFGGFKRKMGTSESFFVNSLSETKTPIELSAHVLRELKNFVHSGEELNSVVITIPASFDTIQSNATKKAGYEAGFEEVVLLQEPIAACLAFVNKGDRSEKSGHWIVYDLGGGTFDVALASINEQDLKIVDHRGDNFLGGLDFDHRLVTDVFLKQIFVVPELAYLQKEYEDRTLNFRRLYQILLLKAEEAKKQLSVKESVDVEIEIQDEDGIEQEVILMVTRDQFNTCIQEKLSYTLTLVEELLADNNLETSDIKQVILVGGSTYIPRVQELLQMRLKTEVNTSVDPTTAVAVGAAQYAAGKQKKLKVSTSTENNYETTSQLQAKVSYPKSSMDTEEVLLVDFEDDLEDHFYRIRREDGGYDTGIIKASSKIREFLTLAPDRLNNFKVEILNSNHEPVGTNIPIISILHGKFSIDGQPLPHDICIEVDDLENKRTKLEVIFPKNSILPLNKTIYREVSKTIYKDGEDKLIVNVLEGDLYALPETNQTIGIIEIDPAKLDMDLVKGSDLEIRMEISESRDLRVCVYLSQTDQEFDQVFNSSEKYVSEAKLEDELSLLVHKIRKDLREKETQADYDGAATLKEYLSEAMLIEEEFALMKNTLSGDEKYHISERKRRLAQKFDSLNKDARLTKLRIAYYELKESVRKQVETHPDESVKAKFNNIISSENEAVKGQSIFLIEELIKKLKVLRSDIYINSDEGIIDLYYQLARINNSMYKDKKLADSLKDQGQKALERQNYKELKVIAFNLHHLLPEMKENSFLNNFKGTGVG